MKKTSTRPKTRKKGKAMGNQFGYLCPNCGRGDYLHVAAFVSVALCPDGTEIDSGDTEWDADSGAWCGHCEWSGNVRDFREVGQGK
jgi:hypothetical protein